MTLPAITPDRHYGPLTVIDLLGLSLSISSASASKHCCSLPVEVFLNNWARAKKVVVSIIDDLTSNPRPFRVLVSISTHIRAQTLTSALLIFLATLL
jgi:hypothetical protein